MAQDILIDDEGDLEIVNGDFRIGNSDEQHVVLLVNTALGSWKQFPMIGVGISKHSAASGESVALKRDITQQMTDDGFVNVQVDIRTSDLDHYNYYITAERRD